MLPSRIPQNSLQEHPPERRNSHRIGNLGIYSEAIQLSLDLETRSQQWREEIEIDHQLTSRVSRSTLPFPPRDSRGQHSRQRSNTPRVSRDVTPCKSCGGLLRKHLPPKRAACPRPILRCSQCGKLAGLASERGAK